MSSSPGAVCRKRGWGPVVRHVEGEQAVAANSAGLVARRLGQPVVREVDRAIDGVVHAERALLCVPMDALIDLVLSDVTDLEDWDAATACVDRLNDRMQLIRAALDERRRAA